MDNISLAIDLRAQLDALRPIDPEQEKRIWQKFRLDWNFHSNNLEGNSLTYGETKSLLLHNITAQGKPLKDHIEITGHNEAIHELMEVVKAKTPLTESFLRQMHVLLLRERYESKAMTQDGVATSKWIEVGQYKTQPNHVVTATGETFHFAEPYEVASKMQSLVEQANTVATSNADGLLLAAKLHYEFVLIHPFDDGNGRMARLLMNLVLMSHGFPPAIIKTDEKEAYFSALRQADGGQFDVFAEYVAGRVCESLQIMLLGAKGQTIDDPDELNKKLALLSRMIEEKHHKLSENRNLDSIELLFELSFLPLVSKIQAIFDSFRKFYGQSQLNVYVDSSMTNGDMAEQITAAQEALSAQTYRLTIFNGFNNLKYKSLDHHSYSSQVVFDLNQTSYTVTYGDQTKLQKSYAEILNEFEFNQLVKEFENAHMKWLQQATGTSLPE
jgi:Fic family protein